MDLRKGVSPLIAAVLLMAFTVAVAATLSEWGLEMVDMGTDTGGEDQQQILDCNAVDLNIIDVEEDYESDRIIVTVESDGPAAGDITVTAFGDQPVYESVSIDEPGGIREVELDVSSQPDEVRAESDTCPGASTTYEF